MKRTMMFGLVLVVLLGGCQDTSSSSGSLCSYATLSVNVFSQIQQAVKAQSISQLKDISTTYQNVTVPAGGDTLRTDVINTIVAAGLFVSDITIDSGNVYLAVCRKEPPYEAFAPCLTRNDVI